MMSSLFFGAAVPGIPGGRGAFVWALLAVLWAVPVAGQFSVQPVIVEMRTPGSGVVGEVITVRNDAATPLQLRIYASDYDQPEDGSHAFMDLGTHARSCADRLAFEPDNLVLDAGASGQVRVRMEPGDSTCWSLVFVQSVARSATGIQVAQRIGVKVYGVPEGAEPAGEIRAVTVLETDGGHTVELSFANSGEAPVRPEGEIEVRSAAGEIVGVVAVAPFSVLPGRVTRTRVALDLELAAGTYIVVPILDFGGDYLAGGQALLKVGGP